MRLLNNNNKLSTIINGIIMHLVANRHSTMCCTTAKYGGQESFIFFFFEPSVAFCILIHHGRGTLTLILTGEGEVGAPSREVALAWGDRIPIVCSVRDDVISDSHCVQC